MPESNPYENFSTEFLAEASENISQFERYFEDHTKLIIAATLFPTIVDKGGPAGWLSRTSVYLQSCHWCRSHGGGCRVDHS